MVTPLLIALVAGYLFGSLPFGYLVARAHGVNIFEVGSRNPGATNVRRVHGKGPGNLVLLLDALKGALAAGWPLMYFHFVDRTRGAANTSDAGVPADWLTWISLAGIIGALLGHSFSCFTGFKGGKGVATGAGGFLVLFPIGMAIALAVWGATAGLTRYVSLASMLGAVSLPIAALVFHRPPVLVSVSAVIALFVILRHRANISRLLAGTESKIGQKAAAPAPARAPKS